MKAECCGKYFTCRICHNEENSHEMNRFATKTMKCMYCFTIQNIGKTCIACEMDLGEYYCEICKFHDSTEGKEIYHCNECGICRLGRREQFFHCKNCRACINVDLKDNHGCVEGKVNHNCPVCLEFLFSSRKETFFPACAHPIHFHCLETVYNIDFLCPTCNKSMNNEYIPQISANRKGEMINDNPMPKIFADTKVEIYCQACDFTDIVPYHYFGHKCPKCDSYFTSILSVENAPNFKELQIPIPHYFVNL